VVTRNVGETRRMNRWFLVLACLFLAIGTGTVQADPLITAAQAQLKTLGYYKGKVDGIPGSQTSAAVRRYQEANRLKITGDLNRETIKHMGLTGKTANPKPKYKMLAELFHGGPFATADPNFQVGVIKQAKKNLKTLGYFRGKLDGEPTTQLQAALRAFQRDGGFRQNGRLDKTTLRALNLYEPIYDDGTY